MAVTATVYGKALEKFGQGVFNFGSDTLKVMLTTSSYAPNQDTHDFKDDVTDEVSGTGYTAGGATLGSLSWAYDSTNNRMELTAAASVWTTATFTARYAVVYKDTGAAGTSPLLCYVNFDTDQSPAGVDFTINWHADGLIRLAAV